MLLQQTDQWVLLILSYYRTRRAFLSYHTQRIKNNKKIIEKNNQYSECAQQIFLSILLWYKRHFDFTCIWTFSSKRACFFVTFPHETRNVEMLNSLIMKINKSRDSTGYVMVIARDVMGEAWSSISGWKRIEASTGFLDSTLVLFQESAAAANCCNCQWPRGCESEPYDEDWLASVCILALLVTFDALLCDGGTVWTRKSVNNVIISPWLADCI